jgi:glycosyltransferase involved in cell wall biosynthesis
VLYGYARGLKNWLYLLAERACAPISDRLVALSEGEKRESAAAGIGAPGKWIVVPSGVDVESVEPRRDRPSDAPVRAGTVARLEHVKGIDVLIRAAELLQSEDAAGCEIAIWGEGAQGEELRALAAHLGVDDRVLFVGTEEPVEEFLGGLDIYVQPSRNEGMGRALVLAQAAGLPVVASNVCGIPDVVRQGETGLLVAPEDPGALAAAMGRLVREAATRTAFGRASRAWILSADETGHPRFSSAAMLSRLEDLYRELTDTR